VIFGCRNITNVILLEMYFNVEYGGTGFKCLKLIHFSHKLKY
jgi:hypothetical protein